MVASTSWNGSSNKFASTLAHNVASTSPDQQEVDGLGGYFRNLNQSLSSYCLAVQESGYFSWKATNTQKTSVVTCTRKMTGSICDNDGTYTETYPPTYTATMKPPCCGQCVITAWKAYKISYLSTIQPAWATCVDVGGVLWDPPSALTSVSLVNGFDPASPVPTATSPSSTKTASPRAHLPPVPPMTDPPTQPSAKANFSRSTRTKLTNSPFR